MITTKRFKVEKEIKMSKASEFSEYLRENYPVNNYTNAQRKSLFNYGINDADYRTHPCFNKKQLKCPIYSVWTGILARVYDENQREVYPTYREVSVCEEWLMFSNFRKWFIENHIDGYAIDKDLLSQDNKIYSPETCVFVHTWLNNFTMDVKSRRGIYKIGVNWNNNREKFISRCSNPRTKKREHLGYFDNEINAYNAWLSRKLEHALDLKYEMDAIDLRIYPNVVEIIKSK